MNPNDNNTAEGKVERSRLLRVNGQLALVTGAGRGIGIGIGFGIGFGAAIAQLLAQCDAQVVLTSARGVAEPVRASSNTPRTTRT